jgi:alanyl-tRNA synthetase
MKKDRDGLIKELSGGLGRVAFYFYQTYGYPVEMFKEIIDELTMGEKVNMYLRYRKEKPELFKDYYK